MAVQDDDTQAAESPETPIFEDSDPAGEEGFYSITNLIAELDELQFSLAEASTWQAVGLEDYADLVERANRHALAAAEAAYQRALAAKGVTIAIDTLEDHPVCALETAFAWLQKTSLPLFAKSTYAGMGGSAGAFFNALQDAHVDAVRQTVAAAVTALQADSKDARAHAAMVRIDEHFKRLGIVDVTPAVEKLLGFDEEQLNNWRYAATAGKFRGQLEKAAQLRFRSRHGVEYFDAVIDAMATALDEGTLLNDADIYEGLNFNAASLVQEFNRSLDESMAADIVAMPGMNAEDVEAMRERMEYRRSLCDGEDAPEGTHPQYSAEDFWRHETFQRFGFRSYSHFVQTAQQIYASALANNALRDHDVNVPAPTYDALNEARERLQAARVSLDREAPFVELNLSRDLFFSMLDACASAAAMRDWSHAFDPGQTTDNRLELIEAARTAASRITGTEYALVLPESMDDMGAFETHLKIRKVEETLASALMTLRENGAYPVYQQAFLLLDELETDLLNAELRKHMGMSRTQALEFDARYGHLDMIHMWSDITQTDGQDDTADDDADEESDALQRYIWMMEFRGRFDACDTAQQVELLHDMGESEETYHREMQRVAREALALAMGRMQEAPNDTISNAELLVSIRNCITLIAPKAFENETVFKHIAGSDLKDFLKLEADVRGRAVAMTTPTKLDHGYKPGAAAAAILSAHDPALKGEAAWTMLRDAARHARMSGFSITDKSVLKKAGMTAEDLRKMAQDHAQHAAAEHVHMAIAKGAAPVTYDSMRHHPFNDYVSALTWLTRMRLTPLNDAPYQAMGLTGRSEFVERMRESLLEFTIELESLVLRAGPSAGPRMYLDAMREIRDGYRMLGFDHDRDDRTDLPQGLTANSVNVETVRLAIVRMGFAAVESIMNAPAPEKARYPEARKIKALEGIFAFAERMNASDWRDEKRVAAIDERFTMLGRSRLRRILQKFAQEPDNAARGWRIATAIRPMRNMHQLEELDWFTELFREIGFLDYTTFAEFMAVGYLTQLDRRIKTRLEAEDTADPVLNRDLLRDIGRIHDVIRADIIPDDRAAGLLAMANITREALDIHHRLAASLALPLLARQTEDPFMTLNERRELLEDCFGLQDMAGSENPLVKKIDWETMERRFKATLGASAAACILPDMLRGDVPTMSPGIVNAANILGLGNLSLGNAETMRYIGLSADEADAYAQLNALIVPYQILRALELVEMTDGQGVYDAVTRLHAAAAERGVDLMNPDVQLALGLRDLNEFLNVVDRPAVILASTLSSSLKQMEDPEQISVQAGAIAAFMEATGINTRLNPETLRQAGIPELETLRIMAQRSKPSAPAPM